MNLYVRNNRYWFELENLTRLFFPNEKITVDRESADFHPPFIDAARTDTAMVVRVHIGDYHAEKSVPLAPDDNENELNTVKLLYTLLRDYSGIDQPWGLLTGVRPIKLLRQLTAEHGAADAGRRFLDDYFVSPEKLRLARLTEENERRIIQLSRPDSFSLYVGVPFCPSRCSYCSFVMSSVERAKKLMQPYTELLCREIRETGKIAAALGLRLESVYFGGGTPTTLSAGQLRDVLGAVNGSFDMSHCREFTVEAGRPDTITAEKLYSLKENNVSRISINPQSVSDDVLRAIGRKHTADDFFRAFALARQCGFDNINTDLIAGLPADTPEGFRRSLDAMISLDAACVTVHTLCMKRASTLTQDGKTLNREEAAAAREMLRYAGEALPTAGYIPYYLYRQTRMVGNLENVGWSKPGCESLYNVYVMDETHTILACGCGGVTKLKNQKTGYLKRIFNFKFPYEYIDRFDEILKRKAELSDFYGNSAIDYCVE
ncbi:MAG: coproporphyrinogen dehydrogenase HemZ [Ruminococcus sp.]|nr:coproporphyrinogen dehydrogenase HemZ [Ruminococcus sp.]